MADDKDVIATLPPAVQRAVQALTKRHEQLKKREAALAAEITGVRDEILANSNTLLILLESQDTQDSDSRGKGEGCSEYERGYADGVKAVTPPAADELTAEDYAATTDEEWQWIEDLQEAAISMVERTQNLERMGYATEAGKLRERWSRFHARVQRMKAEARQRDRKARDLKSRAGGGS